MSWIKKIGLLSLLISGGCQSPFQAEPFPSEAMLNRQRLLVSYRQTAAESPSMFPEIDIQEKDNYLAPDSAHVAELDKATAWDRSEIKQPSVATDQPATVVALTLQEVIKRSVASRFDLQIARIVPAMGQQEVLKAKAAFDTHLYSEWSTSQTDRPQTKTLIGNVPVGTSSVRGQQSTLEVGVKRRLASGGQMTVAAVLNQQNNQTKGIAKSPDPAWTNRWRVGLSQPLLRGAGALVNRTTIILKQQAVARQGWQWRQQLIAHVAEVEKAYWLLVLAQRRVVIQKSLLDRAMAVRDQLDQRADFDLHPLQQAQAHSFVENHRQSLLLVQQQYEAATDRLKVLMNDAALPVEGAEQIQLLDQPVALPVKYDFVEALVTATQRRPEVHAALTTIKDASVRHRLAVNQKLPQLALMAQMELFGQGRAAGQSLEELSDGEFVEYLIGLRFEKALGDRAETANVEKARLSRQIAVTQYQKVLQQVVASVKAAARQLRYSERLIDVSTQGRRAAAEHWRLLAAQEKADQALTPTFLLDLKLNSQQRLAQSQVRELEAIVQYHIATVQFYAALGTLLDRRQISVEPAIGTTNAP